MLQVDAAGVVLAADERAHQLFGWSAAELIGHPVGELVADRPGGPAPGPSGLDLVVDACRRDGTRFRARVNVRGGEAGVTLRFHADGATAAEDVVRSTVSGQDPPAPEYGPPLAEVAHDMGNVLSALLIYAEMIERAAKDPANLEALQAVRVVAEHGEQLVAELRAMELALERASRCDQSAHPRTDEHRLLAAVLSVSGEPRR